MLKTIFTFISILFLGILVSAQTREELEKQRQQLKKELEQTANMLNENKAKTKENFVQWKLINDKVNLQDKIIDNINRDINLLDNNIYTIQREVNRYDRLLDTLKQEYAKSMVYAYKNRSNYDFLNFLFSSSSFNDAIRRITYLKSYRSYREMQGENILRTQELRRQRLEELGGAKIKKSIVLETKDKEMATLETQQKEKDRILAELKKQGKQLSKQYTAKNKQLQKVEKAIAITIKKAIDEANRLAIKKAAENKLAISKENTNKTTNPVIGNTKKLSPTKRPAPEKQASVLLNPENMAVNADFIKSRGSLPWPVDKGYLLMHFGRNQLPSGAEMDITCITVATDIGTPVKSIFDGVVLKVFFVDDMQVIVIQHGKYFSTYSNLENVTVQTGQNVKTGQVIGKAAANLDGVGAVDFYINDERNNFDPEKWLRPR
jgi:septal ring factor EnvC (AmiA/AmiB activator)